jgi:hypothetical protein
MKTYHEVQIAFLRGKELPVDLTEYYGRISLYLGNAAFTLLQASNEPVVCISEALAGYDRPIPGKVADLEPGNSVRLGRNNGIEIFDREGQIDEAKLRQIWDEEMVGSLRADDYLSREHTEVLVVSSSDLIIRDLGSKNGTIVKANNIAPGAKIIPQNIPGRRGRLRLVPPAESS